MAHSLSTHHAPAHIANKGRHELIRHVLSMRNSFARHKQTAKHATGTVLQGVAATAGGALAGGLAVKLPHIPRTRVRTDLAIGAAIGVAAASGMLDEHAAMASSFAQGLLGYGTGDVVKGMLLARGMKQAA